MCDACIRVSSDARGRDGRCVSSLLVLGRAPVITRSLARSYRFHCSTLDHVDVSNRAMMEAMDQLLRIDYEMCQTYGDRVPQAMAHMAVPTSPPTANATVC